MSASETRQGHGLRSFVLSATRDRMAQIAIPPRALPNGQCEKLLSIRTGFGMYLASSRRDRRPDPGKPLRKQTNAKRADFSRRQPRSTDSPGECHRVFRDRDGTVSEGGRAPRGAAARGPASRQRHGSGPSQCHSGRSDSQPVAKAAPTKPPFRAFCSCTPKAFLSVSVTA